MKWTLLGTGIVLVLFIAGVIGYAIFGLPAIIAYLITAEVVLVAGLIAYLGYILGDVIRGWFS